MRCLELTLLSVAIVVACGPSPGTTTDSGTSGGSSSGDSVATEVPDGTTSGSTGGATGPTGSTEPTTGSTEPTTGSTGPTDSTGLGTTTTDATTGLDTGDSTGGLVCDGPDREQVQATWAITFPGGVKPASVSTICTVATAKEQPPQWLIGLDCQLDGQVKPVDLTMTRTPSWTPPLSLGEKLDLEYRAELIFWTNEWFSLQSPDSTSLRIGGVSADHLIPVGTTAEEFYGTPISVVEGLCAPGGDDLCGPVERLALAVMWGIETVDVFDGQFGWVVNLPGSYSIWVETATRPVEPQQCDDVPPAWFQAMMQQDIGP